MNIGLAAAMNKRRKTHLEEEDPGPKWPFFHTHARLKCCFSRKDKGFLPLVETQLFLFNVYV